MVTTRQIYKINLEAAQKANCGLHRKPNDPKFIFDFFKSHLTSAFSVRIFAGYLMGTYVGNYELGIMNYEMAGFYFEKKRKLEFYEFVPKIKNKKECSLNEKAQNRAPISLRQVTEQIGLRVL